MPTWYYVADGQQRGPLDEEAFLQVVSQGTVQAETLVWNETLPDWQSYGRVQASLVQCQAEVLATGAVPVASQDGPASLRPVGQAVAAESGGGDVEPEAVPAAGQEDGPVPLRPTTAEPAAGSGQAARAPEAVPAVGAGEEGVAGWPVVVSAPAAPEASGAIRCAECGLPFPPDEVVPIAGQWFCSRCKPLALDKFRDGVGLNRSRDFAGFWIRVAARLVDGVILAVPCVLVAAAFWGLLAALVVSSASGGEFSVLPALIMLGGFFGAAFVLPFAYSVFFVGRYGATPGKMACGLLVVRADGSRVGCGRAAGRYLADLLNGCTFGIGYVIAAFDEEKRALHDHICDTRVVHK